MRTGTLPRKQLRPPLWAQGWLVRGLACGLAFLFGALALCGGWWALGTVLGVALTTRTLLWCLRVEQQRAWVRSFAAALGRARPVKPSEWIAESVVYEPITVDPAAFSAFPDFSYGASRDSGELRAPDSAQESPREWITDF